MRAVLSLVFVLGTISGCEALATFYGTIESSRIEGTFVSVCRGGMPAWQGRWKVTRQRR